MTSGSTKSCQVIEQQGRDGDGRILTVRTDRTTQVSLAAPHEHDMTARIDRHRGFYEGALYKRAGGCSELLRTALP
jgi:hypothetical protein